MIKEDGLSRTTEDSKLFEPRRIYNGLDAFRGTLNNYIYEARWLHENFFAQTRASLPLLMKDSFPTVIRNR